MPPTPCPSPVPSHPQAVLWDFDGTLADTEPLWIAAEFEVIEGELGKPWSMEHAEQLVGSDLIDSASYILNTIGRHDLPPAWMVQQLLDPGGGASSESADELPWRPGALELLAALRAAGMPCALVSASYRVLLDAVLERLPAGLVRGLGRRRRGHPGQAASGAVREGLCPARGRRPVLRGAGGLRDRRPVRQRGRCRGGRDTECGGRSRRRRAG